MDNKKVAIGVSLSIVIGGVIGGLIDYYQYQGEFWRGALIGAAVPVALLIVCCIAKFCFKQLISKKPDDELDPLIQKLGISLQNI